jgi:hypothetical protein
MNGKLAVNIDEEALFELLIAANFAAPAAKPTAGVPADVIESVAEANWISRSLSNSRNHNAAPARPSRLF